MWWRRRTGLSHVPLHKPVQAAAVCELNEELWIPAAALNIWSVRGDKDGMDLETIISSKNLEASNLWNSWQITELVAAVFSFVFSSSSWQQERPPWGGEDHLVFLPSSIFKIGYCGKDGWAWNQTHWAALQGQYVNVIKISMQSLCYIRRHLACGSTAEREKTLPQPSGQLSDAAQ